MRPRRDGCDSRYYVGDGAKMNSFFRELKQRKVYRVALAYAVVAWLVIVGAIVEKMFAPIKTPGDAR